MSEHVYYSIGEGEQIYGELYDAFDAEFCESAPSQSEVDYAKQWGPWKVTTWKKKEVTDSFCEHVADRFFDDMKEQFAEELGNPEDGDTKELDAREKEYLPKFAALVKEYFSHQEVWQCDEIETKTYSADELIEMLKLDSRAIA